MRVAGLALAAMLWLGSVSAGWAVETETVVVGSKNFAESRLLAEIFAQLLEREAAVEVERRFNLAGTQVCFDALRGGAIDLYPEYTGTGLVSLLGEPAEADPVAALNRVRSEFRRRWNLRWLAPLGFENAYEIAVPRPLAERLGLVTISDLAVHSAELRAGFGFEFNQREDGLPGLARAYDLEFAEVRSMQQTIKYQAAGEGRLDVLDVYTTDGRLLVHDLLVLEDDRAFFPSYRAAALVREDLLDRAPGVAAALSLLTEAFDEGGMRELNLRLQEGGEEVERVATDALRQLGLGGGEDAAIQATQSKKPSWTAYLWAERGSILRRTVEHVTLVGVALGLGLLVALPAGLWLERRRRIAEPILRGLAITQTIPSIALLAFMIPLLGIGTVPAIVALWIYSLFPILRNTYTGVRDADPDAVVAATALGMSPVQVLLQVRLPLAAPVLMAGVRTAAVLTVGTATLAAFIGAGGLGEPIVEGLQLADSRRILAGALPAAFLAVVVDLGLGAVERRLRPPGLDRDAQM